MTCKKCGAEIPEDTRFCLKCSEAVEHSVEAPGPSENVNAPDKDAKAEQTNPELTFRKSTQLGRITYEKIDTRVEITATGLRIEKKTKKIFRKEKTEERCIPFSQMASASVHTVFDYWDTLYGVVFVAIGILFNLWALIMAAVCFWCGYGKKVEFLLRSGEKYSFPYKFGKEESSILVELCNQAASRPTETNDTGIDGAINTPTVMPNGGSTTVQDSTAEKFGKILKVAVALIFAVAFIVVVVLMNRREVKFDYIAAVKEQKPFAESLDLDYTYEEVFERYISSATWSSQETDTGADVTVHGSAAGMDEDIAITVEVTTSSDDTVIDPKLVEFAGEKLSEEDDLASFLLVLFQAYDVGYGDFTDILGDEIFSEPEQQDANVETVQNGYLGEYTDITVRNLLWGHYKMTLYDEETWDSGKTDDGKEIVQVTYHDVDGDFEDVNIQFTMLSENAFKVTAFMDPQNTVEKSTDLLAELNYIYFEQYVAEHQDISGDFEKEFALIEQLEAVSGSAVQYGASAEYNGDRSQLCTLTGDLPLDVTAAMLLDSVGLLDLDYYYSTPFSSESEQPGTSIEPDKNNSPGEYTDIPETLFLGNWESDGNKLEITSCGKNGEYNVTLTRYPWPARYATWTYEAKYNAQTGNLDCRNGVRIDHGKFASDKTIVYNGDGAAEILISDDGSLSFVSTSACPEDEDVLSSPIIFRTNNSAAVSEPPASSGLSQYYGFYNSKDLGLFWVTLDKGSDDDSFYVYIEYEPMMKKSDVHADIKPDGEQHMTFLADGMTGSDGIIGDRNHSAGSVSLEILDDESLHMVLHSTKWTDEIPFDVILEPWERF